MSILKALDSHRTWTSPRCNVSALIGPSVWIRASIVAAVLGSALTVVNQYEAVARAAPFDRMILAQMYLTPFAVVLLAQILGTVQACRDLASNRAKTVAKALGWRVALHRPIVLRSLWLGAIAGMTNTALVITASGGMRNGTVAPVLVAQSFILPSLFGLLSLTLAYNRQAGRVHDSVPARLNR